MFREIRFSVRENRVRQICTQFMAAMVMGLFGTGHFTGCNKRMRRSPMRQSLAGLLAVCAALLAAPALADTDMETVLNFFTGTSGALPAFTPVLAPDGNFYGVTQYTTEANNVLGGEGTVYRLSPGGSATTIYTFTGVNGDKLANPTGALLVGSDGYLYGTIGEGANGYGAVYRISTSGAVRILYSFSGVPDGKYPSGTLVQDDVGNLYGTTQAGGINGDGTVFRLSQDGTLTPLYTFSGTNDGMTPSGSMVLGPDGSLYGTTQSGGAGGHGTVFKLDASANFTFSTLYSFTGSAGTDPVSGLAMGADGNLYGTTAAGGAGYGTIFEVTPGGVETTLHMFSSTEGSGWAGLTLGADGNWYGTTAAGTGSSNGIVFSMTPSGTLSVLHTMQGIDGKYLLAGVVPDASGNLYGAAWKWGDYGSGLLFELQASNNPVPPGINLSASPATVGVGQSSTLSWTTSGASQCAADDAWSGAQPTSGSSAITVSQAGANNYTLICAGAGATASQSAVVTAMPLPAVSLSASPGSVDVGQSSTLTWSSSNAQSCTASGAWSGGEPLSGSLSVTVGQSGSNTFTLNCSNAYGSASQTTTVIAYAPPSVTLSAASTLVAVGQADTLSWSASNATSCTATGGWAGSVGTSGTQAVTVTNNGSNTYTLTCTGQGGSAAQSVVVTGAPLPVVNLSASPTSVTVGQTSTLSWSSANATSCNASGSWSGALPVSGSQQVSIAQAGANSYTLTCSGSVGSSSQTVTITGIAPAPAISLSASPVAVIVGQSSTLSWSVSNATACTASGAWSGSEASSGSYSVTVSGVGANSYTLTCTGAGGSAAQTVSVTGLLPTVAFAASAETVKANLFGTAAATIGVNLSAASSLPVTVPYTLGGSEPASGYGVSPSGSLGIAAGATSASLTVSVSAAQCNKTVVITLGTPANASLAGATVNTLTLKTQLLCN